jgi:carbon-monoxide dehydrogenase small subunit
MSDEQKRMVPLNVNGLRYEVLAEPRDTVADVLRYQCKLTGTHVGCEHGVCGSCTISVDGEAVRSCLMFAMQAEGKAIRTVEGLAKGEELHPLQTAFMDNHGLQCGFCTPGFLMLISSALEKKPNLSEEEIRDLVSSNLCRCTGYQNILAAVRATVKIMSGIPAKAEH